MPLRKIARILHPTDFSPDSALAFAHALKLALLAEAQLDIFHLARHPREVQWSEFPKVHETLIRWKVLPEGAAAEDIASLRVSVHKELAQGGRSLPAVLDHLEHRPADLIVLATHEENGVAHWLHRHAMSHIERLAKKPTLFVPHGSRGFVDAETGSLDLGEMLIPFDATPPPQLAIDAVRQLTAMAGEHDATCHLLHVHEKGDSLSAPPVPQNSGIQWKVSYANGELVPAITDFSATQEVRLIALTTQGQHGFLDALRDRTAESLLRVSGCPVLTIPRESGGP